jgi:poly(A) polymerase/tRNA nucleotidyltransferase (CCA-adding enzyme)
VDSEARVLAWLARQDVAAYLVGGSIRDRLLQRQSYDLDVAVASDGLVLARRLADHFQGAFYPLDVSRDVGRAVLNPGDEHCVFVDIARFRGPDLATDLADRDFTINALAVDVRVPHEVIDHHGGLSDLDAGLIQPVSEESIRGDPLRALRAVRQAAQLGFTLSRDTETLIHRDGAALAGVSGERIRDELARLLALSFAASYLDRLDDLTLLSTILPELEALRGLEQPAPHYLDTLHHSLETVRALELILYEVASTEVEQQAGRPGVEQMPNSLSSVSQGLFSYAEQLQAHLMRVLSDVRTRLVTLKLAALLHDIGKASARTLDEQGRIRFIGHEVDGARMAGEALRRLRFSNLEVRLGETIIRNHLRPLLLANEGRVTPRAVYRFFRDTGEAGVEVLLHALADRTATDTPDAGDESWSRLVALTERMLGDYWQRQAESVNPPSLIDGHDLLHEFDLQPGPSIGGLLEAVREAQANGEVTTRDEALALIYSILEGEDASQAV